MKMHKTKAVLAAVSDVNHLNDVGKKACLERNDGCKADHKAEWRRALVLSRSGSLTRASASILTMHKVRNRQGIRLSKRVFGWGTRNLCFSFRTT
jgi:hypothetical protein